MRIALEFGGVAFLVILFLVCGAGIGLPKWKDILEDRAAWERHYRYQDGAQIALAVILIGGFGLALTAMVNGWLK